MLVLDARSQDWRFQVPARETTPYSVKLENPERSVSNQRACIEASSPGPTEQPAALERKSWAPARHALFKRKRRYRITPFRTKRKRTIGRLRSPERKGNVRWNPAARDEGGGGGAESGTRFYGAGDSARDPTLGADARCIARNRLDLSWKASSRCSTIKLVLSSHICS